MHCKRPSGTVRTFLEMVPFYFMGVASGINWNKLAHLPFVHVTNENDHSKICYLVHPWQKIDAPFLPVGRNNSFVLIIAEAF